MFSLLAVAQSFSIVQLLSVVLLLFVFLLFYLVSLVFSPNENVNVALKVKDFSCFK